MKKLKLSILVAMLILAMIAMSACGKDSKPNDASKKTDQTQTSTNSNSNESSSGGTVSVGEKLTWPKALLGSLPEPKGKITAIIKDENKGQCTVAFAEMTKEDAKAYAAKIKEIGYTAELEAEDAEALIISGTSKEGSQVCFTYNITTKEGTIFYSSKADNTTSSTDNTPSDMTDAMPWPKDFIKEIPELTGKIIDVSNNNDKKVSVYLEYVNKVDFEKYVKQLKENGFTVDSDENSNVDSIDFRAYNAAGDHVHAYLTISQGSNKATIDMEKASN